MAIFPTVPTQLATALAERLAGAVIAPDHFEYETARRVWNGMIDKRPAAIARCADADDVATAVRFAAEQGLPLAVRGGGHNVAGTAVVDDGLVIDLSAMRAVRIDAAGRTVHVQGGATWADVDRVTAPLGLAAPGGVVSETGVAGLALNGGVSHQRRRDGMTVDNLISAEVVLADGRQVRASAGDHADLHWALRGGGGNFGVVTSFELRLHELGPEVFALNVAYPIEDAGRVLAGWRDAVADAPDELSTAGLIWSLPAVDELPEQLRGLPYVGVAGSSAELPVPWMQRIGAPLPRSSWWSRTLVVMSIRRPYARAAPAASGELPIYSTRSCCIANRAAPARVESRPSRRCAPRGGRRSSRR